MYFDVMFRKSKVMDIPEQGVSLLRLLPVAVSFSPGSLYPPLLSAHGARHLDVPNLACPDFALPVTKIEQKHTLS